MASGCLQDLRRGMCDENTVLLRELECKRCHLRFNICRKCYRGQVYCSSECRIAAQLEAQRQAQQKYRGTEKGLEAHRKAERRRRMGRSKKNEKTVDDEGTTPPPACVILYPVKPNMIPRCSFCGSYGVIVEKFPHRGYGSRHHKRTTAQNCLF